MKNFFSTIAATFYNPAFYADARTKGFDKPVWTTAFLGAIGVFLWALFIYANILPFAFSDIVSKVEAIYPDELVIQMARGELSINQPEPYYIKNTFDLDPGSTKKTENLVVFDTVESLKGGAEENSTFILVRKTYALAVENNGERITQFASFATTSTTTIAKSDVLHVGEIIRPYVKPAIIIGGLLLTVLGSVFIAAFWVGFHLLYLLLPGVLIYLFGRFREPQFVWKESYIVAVYASIPVAILSFALSFTPWHLPVFMYTLIVMLVALINLTQVPNQMPAEHLDAPETH